ncbi:MAG: protein adenylyltransferase SelO [Verrucomicrobiaceae bacterium]
MPFEFKNTYARLPGTFFQKVDPTPVSSPSLIAINHDLCADLGINPASLETDRGLAFLSGNEIPKGAEPLAMAYSGHQFASFNPQLGDGRAILLGEVSGKDIQLKGSGPTPYSRRGDGRSALGPVLREYLLSEAMHALGVPTTRALAAVTTGEQVVREELEPGGILTRVASSHLRIGTVQYFAARQDLESLAHLVDYAISRHHPAATNALELLQGVIARQAQLIAQWMSIGFIHGVMNTDNMSLTGETIDYGPCAFMDRYNPAQKYSFIDRQGRYAYQNQPGIAQWNLTRLAEALLPLLGEDEDSAVASAKDALEQFPDLYKSARLQVFSKKIGLPNNSDWSINQDLLDLMADQQADFTLTFRHLASSEPDFLAQFKNPTPAQDWLTRWKNHPHQIDHDLMRRTNPIFIPRNHRVAEVIKAAYAGDFGPFHRLHHILNHPFTEQPQNESFEQSPAPEEIVCNTFCGT